MEQLFLYIYTFLFSSKRHKVRGIEREFPSAICWFPCCSKWNSIQVSHRVTGTTVLEPLLLPLSVCTRENQELQLERGTESRPYNEKPIYPHHQLNDQDKNLHWYDFQSYDSNLKTIQCMFISIKYSDTYTIFVVIGTTQFSFS